MDKKIVNNAICAYLGMGALLIIPNKNKYINNEFVKSHSKTAIFIHFLFLITYILFISFSFLGKINIYGFGLNEIISSVIFILLFFVLIFGIYKSTNGEYFFVKDVTNFTKTNKLVEIKESSLNEQGIFTIILSLIPVIGFIIKGKFKSYKSPIIENNLKLNLIITISIYLLFLSGYSNLGILFILIISILIAFYSILIIANNNIINFKLTKIPDFEEGLISIQAFLRYFLNYFGKNSFKKFDEQKTYFIEKRKNFLINNKNIIPEKENKLNEIFYYIPFVNIIGLIDYNSKFSFHIKNGVLITILSLIALFINPNLEFFVIILAFFGYGYTKSLEYQFPILGNLYNLVENNILKIFTKGKKIKDNTKKVEETSFQI